VRLGGTVADWRTKMIGKSRRPPLLVVSCFLLVYLAILLGSAPKAPVLSSDGYRYIWDGRVSSHGYNPYSFPPDAAALSALQDPEVYPRVFRPDMRTVYPPGAQALFWVAARMTPNNSGSFVALRSMFALHLFIAIILFLRAQSRYNNCLQWQLSGVGDGAIERKFWIPLLSLACSPLILFYGIWDYHLDILLLPYVVLAFFWFDRSQIASGLSLACAALIRPLILWIAPVLIFDALRLRRYRFLAASVGLSVVVTVYVYLLSGPAMFESLIRYGREWVFNSMIYSALVYLLDLEGIDGILRTLLFVLSVLMSMMVATYAVWKDRYPGASAERDSVEADIRMEVFGIRRRSDAAILGCLAYVWCTPTLYPWYMLCIQPLFAQVDRLGGTLLGIGLMLSETVYLTGEIGGYWEPVKTVRVIEALLLLIITVRTARRLVRALKSD